MNTKQGMKEKFDTWEDIVHLRKLEKEGSQMEQAEASARIKAYWIAWQECWPLAIKTFLDRIK